MAGKEQHHIWRFLQKGFARKEFGDDHLWVYTREEPPRRTVARRHGVESFFYGEANSVADSNITSFENTAKHVINVARTSEEGASLPSAKIAPLISHLEMRSLFLRAESSKLAEQAVRRLSEILSLKEDAAKLMLLYFERHPELLEKYVRDQGLDGPIVDLYTSNLRTMLPAEIRKRSSQLAEMAKLVFEPMIGQIAEIAKNSHIKALEADFSETERTNLHLAFTYSVQRFPGEALVLPDTNLACLNRKDIRPVSSKGMNHKEILLPISSEVMIVGHLGKRESRSLPEVRRILATCAYDNFVAEEFSDELAGLSKRIGKNARLLSQSELSKVLSFKSLVSDI